MECLKVINFSQQVRNYVMNLLYMTIDSFNKEPLVR